MSSVTQLGNGWIRIRDTERRYPFTGLPPSTGTGGIEDVQWLNLTHGGAALLLCFEGSWQQGGIFSVWYSPGGPGHISPSALDVTRHRVAAGDSSGWRTVQDAAIADVELWINA